MCAKSVEQDIKGDELSILQTWGTTLRIASGKYNKLHDGDRGTSKRYT